MNIMPVGKSPFPLALLWIAVWHIAIHPGPAGTAFGEVAPIDFSTFETLDPAMQEKVKAALVRINQSPDDISAVETLLAVDPSVVKAVGTNLPIFSMAPVQGQALKWCQSLQPAEVLVTSLEKGSDAAIDWALKQILWRSHNDWFDKETLARLMPGVEKALVKPSPATRAQAVRTMLVCLPAKDRFGFLKGLLKGQPDEVRAQAVESFANDLRESDPEVEVIVAGWLNASDDPLSLRACCTYWWLIKSPSKPFVKVEEIAAFERITRHEDAAVRLGVALAVEGVATPDRPRLIGVLLRLASDKDSSVKWYAVRALRNANTPEVTAWLRDLYATDQEGSIRAAAIEVLGIFGKDNLPLILNAAKTDKDTGARMRAVYALRQIGTSEAGKGLDAARQDPEPAVRSEANTQYEWYLKEHPTRQ